MSDLNDRLKKLSPEKRALLEKKLRINALAEQKKNAIPHMEYDEYYPMSSHQERLWFLNQLDTQSSNYNMPYALRLKGNIRKEHIEDTFMIIVNRHEILNSIYSVKSRKPVQNILIGNYHLDYISNIESKKKLEDFINEEADKPFDLSSGPLYRIKLIKINSDEHLLLITFHHIIADGWSISILLEEFTIIYSSISRNEQPDLATLPIQYYDYAAWRKKTFDQEKENNQLNYWKKKLSGMPQILDLPYKFNKANKQTNIGDRIIKNIPNDLFKKAKKIILEKGITPFIFYLTVFEVALSKYSHQNDFGIGILYADRQQPETKKLIGFFVNTLVKRSNINNHESYEYLLKKVKADVLEVNQNSLIPFDKIVNTILEERNNEVSPLFQVLFDYQIAPPRKIEIGDLKIEAVEQKLNSTKFNLAMIVEEEQNGAKLNIEYNTEKFDKEIIERFTESFILILQQISDSTELKIKNIKTISQRDRELISLWNNTDREFDKNICIHELIRERSIEFPDRQAIIHENKSITYKELERLSDKIAAYLIANNIKHENVVGIFMPSSIEFLVAAIGIMKSGAAYLPLDPNYPEERIKYMLRDSDAKIILSSSTQENDFIDNLPNTIFYEDIINIKYDIDIESIKVFSSNTAYYIYTSGSTGKPKGVMCNHLGVINHYYGAIRNINFSEPIISPLWSSPNFDGSIMELFHPLLNGGTLKIVPEKIRPLETELFEWIKENRINYSYLPPFMLDGFAKYLEANLENYPLKRLFVGVEPIKRGTLQRIQKSIPDLLISNGYGPTETTIYSTSLIVTDFTPLELIVPIGKAISNTKIFLLDENLNLVPHGVLGEIYISSIAIAKGYVGKPDLTAEKFIPNYFTEIGGERLYKTGDLGKYDENGDIVFAGRIDNQIKLRGFRIELGEIENSIKSLSYINDAVVLLDKPGNKNAKIVACIIPNSDAEHSSIKRDLGKTLPTYMIPNLFVEFNSFPQTPNNKIDRRAIYKVLIKKGVNQNNYKKISTDKHDDIKLNDSYIIPSSKNLNEDYKKDILIKYCNITDTNHNYSNLIVVFNGIVQKQSNSTAIISNDKEYTYSYLNVYSNKLANYLRSIDVKIGDYIGLSLSKSFEQIAVILATVKMGCIYVPFESTSPKTRINHIVEETKLKIILADNSLDENLFPKEKTVLLKEIKLDDISTEFVPPNISDYHPLYVMYTSGTTGFPKGVQVSHRAVHRLVVNNNFNSFNYNTVTFMLAPISFDASTLEIWGTLLNGGKLVIGDEKELSLKTIKNTINKHKVNFLWLTSGLFSALVDEEVDALNHVKHLMSGGDVLSVSHIRKLLDKRPSEFMLTNGYGPTENTTFTTTFSIPNNFNENDIPIGKPISGTSVYILDSKLDIQEFGEVGELLSGGVGIADCYINDPMLTAEKFLSDPFSNIPGSRMYKTGDLVKYDKNGNIRFIGRIDRQVKIRGYRVELREIEYQLNKIDFIKQSVVIINELKNNNKELIAFIKYNDNQDHKIEEINSLLSVHLPQYMLLNNIMRVDDFPLTNNGKVDKNKLLFLYKNFIEKKQHDEPRNKLEEKIKNELSNLLSKENIGIHDNFFSIGGNSIQAAVFANHLQDLLKANFHVGSIFFAPTIYEISKYINKYYPEQILELFGKNFDDYYTELDEDIFLDDTINTKDLQVFNDIIKKQINISSSKPIRKNKKAIFILSPPRSGSTLLRVMLEGSEQLFAPPELELLSFNSMKERGEKFSREFEVLKEGLTKAIMELKNFDQERANLFIRQYEEKDYNTINFYSILQKLVGEKILVDKTPIYSISPDILNRIEENFEDAIYIHLIRNPYAVIYSFIEAKMDNYIIGQDHGFGIRQLAELVWYVSNKNITNFLNNIPDNRKTTVRFEDMVSSPEMVMKSISNFLGIEYNPSMIEPYKGNKMTEGTNELLPMVGDLKFYVHKKIKSDVVDAWKTNHKKDFISDFSLNLAKEFNYAQNDLTTNISQKKHRDKFENYLINLWKDVLEIDKLEIDDDFFEIGGNSLHAAVLANRIQQDLQVEIKPQSIFLAPTIRELTSYAREYYPDLIEKKFGESVRNKFVEIELEKSKVLTEDDFNKFKSILRPLPKLKLDNSTRNPKAIFILSPPRSGSTLLRVMLEGHHKLFSPPELDLLSFNTLGERKNKLSGNYGLWLQATVRAIMELKNVSADEAKKIMSGYEQQNLSIKEFYGILQSMAGERILVDKTPTYGLDINILNRAEQYFDNPLYIHLTRNPYASIYSFIEAKLDENFFRYKHDFSRQELAELIWTVCHDNVSQFLENIHEHRKIKITFEDLVTNSFNEMEKLANFIGIEFSDKMLNPYDGKRMTDAVEESSQMVGDFKFYLRKKIDPSATQRWKNHHKNDFLSNKSIQVANRLGYDVEDIRKSKISSEVYSKIEKFDKTKNLPLSFAQQRLWFLEQLDPGKSTYNIPSVLKIVGNFNLNIFKNSLNKLIKRHESLRTVFTTEAGKPKIQVIENLDLDFIYNDFSTKSDLFIKDSILEFTKKSFILDNEQLFRVMIIKAKQNEFYLVISMHHIISDGWSTEIMVKELVTIYNGERFNSNYDLPKLDTSYIDYAAWQRKWLESDDYKKQLEYWKNKLVNIPKLLELPLDETRPAVQQQVGKRLQFEMDENIVKKLNEIAGRENTTLFINMFTVFNVLLNKYSNSYDIVVGTPVAGRSRSEIENIIGFFVNTLVLRNKIDTKSSLKKLLHKVKENFFEDFANQDIPFEKLVDELNIERSLSHSPLFQVMFVMNNSPLSKVEFDNLSIEPMSLDLGNAKFDITFVLTKRNNKIRGSVEFDAALFKIQTIERLINHYNYLLEIFVNNINTTVEDIELLTEDEKDIIINKWNATDYKLLDQNIVTLFYENLENFRLHPSVEFKGNVISYEELDKKSNQLANYLLDKNVKREEIIGIYTYSNIDAIVSILGIIKAGCAYLPLDPLYPKDRLQYMIDKCSSKIIIVNDESESTSDLFDANNHSIINIKSSANSSEEKPQVIIDKQNLAYVVFTSGSTGYPKAVGITHEGVINHVQDFHLRKKLPFGFNSSLWTSLNFDVSVYEIFYPLLYKGKLEIIPEDIRLLDDELFDWLAEHNIENCYLPPFKIKAFSHWLENKSEYSKLYKMLTGVESIKYEYFLRIKEKLKDIQILNGYGPAETTICSTVFNFEEGLELNGNAPIGRPMNNTKIYILDHNLNLVPNGVVGEIFIESIGIARGYINSPETTAEKFIPNLFSKIPGKRIYRTGDTAKYLPDGNIMFIGRKDNQVKIRGFRVELGEIENHLKNINDIRDAVVLIREDSPNEKKMVAYLIMEEGAELIIPEIKNRLSESVPDYMIPSIFIQMDKFPKLPNNKVDRKSFPEPKIDRNILTSEYVEASDEIENVLVEIWKEVLKLDNVGTEDNFFELGGDSILGIQVIAKANQNGIKLSPKNLFQNPTIKGLATFTGQSKPIIAEQGMVSGEANLTPIQKWFFERKLVNENHWNQSILLELNEKLNPEILSKTLNLIVNHHDALRTLFVKKDGNAIQVFNDKCNYEILDYYENISESNLLTLYDETQSKLDIESGQVFQCAYFNLSNGNDRLLIVAHHLVIDAVSWRILTEDLQKIYSQLTKGIKPQLPLKSTDYKYWSKRLFEHSKVKDDGEYEYWLKQKQIQDQSKIDKELDKTNTEDKSVIIKKEISVNETKNITSSTERLNVDIKELLFTCLVRSYSKLIRKRVLTITLESHGREDLFNDVDISRTVGWFTTLYPVVIDLESSITQIDTINIVKKILRSIPQNGFSYMKYYFLTEGKINSDIPHLSEISFNYLGIINTGIQEKQIFIPSNENKGQERAKANIRPFQIDVSCSVLNGKLLIHCAYNNLKYGSDDMDNFINDLTNELLLISQKNELPNQSIFASDLEIDVDENELDSILSELGEDFEDE